MIKKNKKKNNNNTEVAATEPVTVDDCSLSIVLIYLLSYLFIYLFLLFTSSLVQHFEYIFDVFERCYINKVCLIDLLIVLLLFDRSTA